MNEERKQLIETFEKMLATNPRKSIVGAWCANIAEAYAKQQLETHSKDEVIAILEKRVKDAFSNGMQNYESDALNLAIQFIRNLVPPSCFDIKQQSTAKDKRIDDGFNGHCDNCGERCDYC